MALEPDGTVSVCPGDNATFWCMTTGGALLWETSSTTANFLYNDASQPPVAFGIFQLRLVGIALNDENETVAVNSTATTTDVQLAVNGVTLGCRETTNFALAQAVLSVAGKFLSFIHYNASVDYLASYLYMYRNTTINTKIMFSR